MPNQVAPRFIAISDEACRVRLEQKLAELGPYLQNGMQHVEDLLTFCQVLLVASLLKHGRIDTRVVLTELALADADIAGNIRNFPWTYERACILTAELVKPNSTKAATD